MDILFKGKSAKVVKENFYCKAGAYEHKYRQGWALYVGEKMVLGGIKNGSIDATRHDHPTYKTRKSLLEDVEFFNNLYEKRKSK